MASVECLVLAREVDFPRIHVWGVANHDPFVSQAGELVAILPLLLFEVAVHYAPECPQHLHGGEECAGCRPFVHGGLAVAVDVGAVVFGMYERSCCKAPEASRQVGLGQGRSQAICNSQVLLLGHTVLLVDVWGTEFVGNSVLSEISGKFGLVANVLTCVVRPDISHEGDIVVKLVVHGLHSTRRCSKVRGELLERHCESLSLQQQVDPGATAEIINECDPVSKATFQGGDTGGSEHITVN